MPKLASTEGGGRRWLPRELIYELLQFVSGKFWSARRLLTTSAVLFRIIINGKHAKIWRQPYDVRTSFVSEKRGLRDRTFRHWTGFKIIQKAQNYNKKASYKDTNSIL
uniref:F-box domain-containing protein n=1 Tax=Globodera pallida TaxID=36090 RepID=A0A183CJK3_GLOPA